MSNVAKNGWPAQARRPVADHVPLRFPPAFRYQSAVDCAVTP